MDKEFHSKDGRTMKNKAAQELGKLSAKKRKKLGHDKKYYSELAKKRWRKV